MNLKHFVLLFCLLAFSLESSFAQGENSGPGVWQVRDADAAKSVLMAVDFADDQTGWAVGLNSLSRTINGGRGWTNQWKQSQTFWLNGVAAISPQIAMASGLPYGREGAGVLLRTEDGGRVWKSMSVGGAGAGFHSLKFRADKKTGYVISTIDGLMKTVDGGATWSTLPLPQGATRTFVAARGVLSLPDEKTIFVGADDNVILHSGDDGATWSTLPLPTEAHAGHRQFLWTRFVSPLRGWVQPFGNDHIWQTNDGGKSWQKSTLAGVPFFRDALNGWAIGPASVSATTDGGASWTAKTELELPNNMALMALAFTGKRAYVVGGSEGGKAFFADSLLPGAVEEAAEVLALHAPIAIRFSLPEAGLVSLVIENEKGIRVRNLVSETSFPAGANVVYWDGLDESGRINETHNGVYDVQGKLVAPGEYRVRGLFRKPLDLRYEFTIYNEGQVPWATSDRASQWLTNHSPPAAIVYLPPGLAPSRAASEAKDGQLLVGSEVSEGGSGLAWIDTQGRKLNGQEWVGGVWTGATHLARDVGDKPVAGVYAYTGSAWGGDGYNGNKPELRLHELVTPDQKRSNSGAWVNGVWDPTAATGGSSDTRMGSGEDRRLLASNFSFPGPLPADQRALAGLAVRNGLLVASLPTLNQLMFVDARARKIIGAANLDAPRGVAFDASGRLLALSGNRLLRFALPANLTAQDGKINLPKAQTVVAEGLDDPQIPALDSSGNIYISNRGALHQVKVFDGSGKFLRAIGKAGAPAAGPYDAQRMNNPYGLTIAKTAGGEQLWVAEEDYLPKRLSVWSLTGVLQKGYYGPTIYGGGGGLDPGDKNRFFHDGIEFKIDWKSGEDTPVNIYHRPKTGELDIPPPMFTKRPETPLRVGNRVYITNAYTGHPTNGVDVGGVWQMRNGVAKLVAAAGHVGSWPELKGIARDGQNFSVRWKGQIQAATSGTYSFATLSDDGVRLWVDGKRLINHWTGHGPTEDSGTIELQAGRRYDIVLEYYNGSGGGTLKLLWSAPNVARAIIPAANLFADAKATKPGGLSGQYFEGIELRDLKKTQTDSAIDFDWNASAPAALLGGASELSARLPQNFKPGEPLTFAWSDDNDNGKIDAPEIAFRAGWKPGGGVTVGPDLTISLPDSIRLEPKFSTSGVPRYDLNAAQKRFDWLVHHPTSGGGQILEMPDGFSIAMAGPIQGFRGATENGAKELTWTYPNSWPGLHASHFARLAKSPGEILGATRLLGPPISLRSTDSNDKTPIHVWGVNGNMGNGYMMTSDGLFVATLFKDHREAKPWPDKAARNMPMNSVSMGGESFFNTLMQADDGNIYIQNSNHIIRVDGLNTLRRLPAQTISVTPQLLSQAQDFFVQRDALRQEKRGAGVLKVALRAAPVAVDGKLDEWKDEDFVDLDVKTKAAASISGDTLYLAYKTGYRDLLRNKIESVPLAFKTGGALDLMIGTDAGAPENRTNPAAGDQRLLITREGEKTVAVRYRAVVPGAKEPVPFASPSRTVSFDRVDEVGAQIKLAQGTAPVEEFHEGNVFGNRIEKYEGVAYEVAIPLSLLDLRPIAGQTIKGDLGILIGNGFQTIQRVYWNNKGTALVSDIPGEAMLTPQLWGQWEFEAAP